MEVRVDRRVGVAGRSRRSAAAGSFVALRFSSYKHRGQQNVVVFTDVLAALNGRVTPVDSTRRPRPVPPLTGAGTIAPRLRRDVRIREDQGLPTVGSP